MTTLPPRVHTPSRIVEDNIDATPGFHPTSGDHDNNQIHPVIIPTNLDFQSTEPAPPTEEEIDALNNDWYEHQKQILDAELERRRLTGKAIMGSSSKRPTRTAVAVRHGESLGQPPVDQACA